MYKKKIRRNEVYHLDMLDLAYRGMSSGATTNKSSRIQRRSYGLRWNIFPAYFPQYVRQGHTERNNSVFGKGSIPPLSRWHVIIVITRIFPVSTDISKSEIESKIMVYVQFPVKAIYPGAGKHTVRGKNCFLQTEAKEMNAGHIYLNPVRAGAGKEPGDYLYSVINIFTSPAKAPDWLGLNFILSIFDKNVKRLNPYIKKFVLDGLGNVNEIIRKYKFWLLLGNQDFIIEDIKN